jgi:hypothetical protein
MGAIGAAANGLIGQRLATKALASSNRRRARSTSQDSSSSVSGVLFAARTGSEEIAAEVKHEFYSKAR